MAKVWLITGASRGLGLAITEAVLEAGDNVIATARNPENLSHLVAQFGESKVLPLALDVVNYKDVLDVVKKGQEKFDHIDVVVNNAGYANTVAVEDIEIDDFRAQVDTNFYGVVHMSKAIIPIFRKQGSGHIFQVSSLGGRVGTPGLAAYQSSKWAVGGFSTVLSHEVGPLGVKVTVLEPGGIRTDWAGSSMKVPPVSEPYKNTVGSTAEMLRSSFGKEPSLPNKIATIIINLAGKEDAPLRLLIGPDAVGYGGQVAEALATSDQQWRDISLSSS